MALGITTLRRLLAGGVAGVLAVATSQVAGGSPAIAGSCQRMVVINPQLTVGEGARRVVFTVFSGGCAAAGTVDYAVLAGTADPYADYTPVRGRLRWDAKDSTTRWIIVPVRDDSSAETALEDFTLTLVNPSQDVAVVLRSGHGRILDDDGQLGYEALDDQFCPDTPIDITPPRDEPWLVGEQRLPECNFVDGVIIEVGDWTPTELHFATRDGTATAGLDFVGVDDKLVVVAPRTELIRLPIELLERPSGTPSRWFHARIFAPSQGVVVDGTAVVTIQGSPLNARWFDSGPRAGASGWLLRDAGRRGLD